MSRNETCGAAKLFSNSYHSNGLMEFLSFTFITINGCFINSNPTLSHGERNFLFQFVSISLTVFLNAGKEKISWHTHATEIHFTNLIGVMNSVQLSITYARLCRLMLRFSLFHLSRKAASLLLSVGGKFIGDLTIILINKRPSSCAPLKHYCLSNHQSENVRWRDEHTYQLLKNTKKIFFLFAFVFFHIICNLLAWHC